LLGGLLEAFAVVLAALFTLVIGEPSRGAHDGGPFAWGPPGAGRSTPLSHAARRATLTGAPARTRPGRPPRPPRTQLSARATIWLALEGAAGSAGRTVSTSTNLIGGYGFFLA
jgi:hypothetical protein